MTTRPPSSSSRSNRKDNHDRRLVSQDVALPNSSRRSSARKSRSGGTASTKNGFACNEGNVCVCGRCGSTHRPPTNSISYRTTTKKSSSSPSASQHRSSPQPASGGSSSSTDRRDRHRSSKEDHHKRSSNRNANHEEQHHSSSSSSNRNRSSRHRRDRDNDDSSQIRSDNSNSNKRTSSSRSNNNKPNIKTSIGNALQSNTQQLQKIVKKISRGSNSSNDKSEKEHHNDNDYEVFYDEHGKRILLPKAKSTSTSSKQSSDHHHVSSEPTTTNNLEEVGRGYHSSDFESESGEEEEDNDDNESSVIDGASDKFALLQQKFLNEGGEGEDEEEDYIDGASDLDGNEIYSESDYMDGHHGDDDYDGIEEDEEEDIEHCDYDIDEMDETNSLGEEEGVDDHYDTISEENLICSNEVKTSSRSNSPELNDTLRNKERSKVAMERMVRNLYCDEIGDVDPPSSNGGRNRDDEPPIVTDNSMEPKEDETASLRLDRPPTPESDKCDGISDNLSRMSVRGGDPPEDGRGCDPPPTLRGTSAATALPSQQLGRRVRKPVPAKEKKPEIRGILKKKEGAAPPRVAYFGGTSASMSDDDEDSDDDSGSDPDVSETKSTADESTQLSLFDDKSISTAKSGLRQGRFAAANAAAAAASSHLDTIGDDDDEEEDEDDGNDSDSIEIDDADEDDNTYDHAKRSHTSDLNNSFPSLMGDDSRFNRDKSHYLRTSDLGLTQDTIFAEQFLDDPNAKPEPHYHHPSPHPPPGVQFNCDENWISVDDGNGDHSPIAPQAVDALVATGYRAACDPMMWTPTAKTRKFMTEKGLRFDDIPTPAPPEEEGGRGDSSCLVWSGKFPHKHYGHDQPVIRSQGIVNMSAEELVDLLMDSTRVESYNISSIGRKDELMLSDGTDLDSCPFSGQRKKKLSGVVIQGAKIIDGNAVGFEEETDDEQSDYEEEEVTEMEFDDDGKKSVRTYTTVTSSKERRKSIFVGVTKLVRSTNKVPMRKNLEYFTLLHCRALTDDQGGNGYIIVGRAVTPAQDAEKGGKDAQRAEILLNVHIIRRLREKKSKDDKRKRMSSRDRAKAAKMRNRCLMINVVHVKSPIIPNMLAKKVGLSAAGSFISDIRALTEE